MKKILAFILVAVLALGMAACGAINKTPVAVLWAEGDTAVIPNSLINAMDRAMYIENIAYQYYGAQGDQAKQTAQAEEALKAGATVLMVELVDNAAAQSIVDLAKAKGAHVVFFACDVDAAVVSSYEKCVLVQTNAANLEYSVNLMISNFLKDNDKADRNGDGNITYCVRGALNVHVPEATQVDFNLVGADLADAPDFIVTADDKMAFTTLLALQLQDYNTDKLVTHGIPVFTVGNTVDYKSYVLEKAPEDAEARKNHFEYAKHLCDLTAVKEEDLAEMIFTTINVIDTGRLTGTVLEDHDALAGAAAAAVAAIVKGEAVAEAVIKVPYTVYGG